MKEKRPVTVFCDIDGTLIKHYPPTITALKNHEPEILPHTLEKLLEWDKNGFNIILTSGRRESMRNITEKQLSALGIIYDQLILGIGGGHRVLINDRKTNSKKNYAHAINIDRNQGIEGVNINYE